MKKRVALGTVVVAAFVGVAALLFLQFLPARASAPAQTAGESDGPVMVLAVEEVINGERFGGEVRVTFEDPEELPAEAAAAHGLFVAREGETLTLGTGAIEVEVSVEVFNDEEPTTVVEADYDGDEVQVRITPETVIYEDTTQRPLIGKAELETGHLALERTVEPGSLDGIGDNMMVRVWGSEQGGEIVADVLVYEAIR